MKAIGITGGVGAGKSAILAHLAGTYNCRVVIADRLAHQLEEPGGACFEPLLALLGEKVLAADGRIDKQKMAAAIFADETVLQKVNATVHPAVKEAILQEIEKERAAGSLDYLFVEAALLIEEGYADILDELWYIHAEGNVRRRRLRDSRGYPEEKIDSIMKSQLAEADFRKFCDVVIENNAGLESVYAQIEKELRENQWQKQ
ncbi:MAG: dephospho-CoA kinase [Eubacterium sp.]|nr:dephospho-CoA kinase [Eubacterium sp.]